MKKLNKEQIEKLHQLIEKELVQKMRYSYLNKMGRITWNEKDEFFYKEMHEKYEKELNEYIHNTIKISTNEKMERLYELETQNKNALINLKEKEIEITFRIFQKLRDYEKQIKEIIELATKEKNEKVKIEIENQKINLELKKKKLQEKPLNKNEK